MTPPCKLAPRPCSKHEKRTAGSAWETWTVGTANSVCFACVRWEINFLLTFETAPFICKHTVLDWCLGNIHWWEVDWHWHMIFVSNGSWSLTSRPLKLSNLTLTNYVFPVLRWQISKISGGWSTVSLQEQCVAISNSFHEQWMESKPAHLVFRIIKFGALWLFFVGLCQYVWGWWPSYEVSCWN